MDGCQCPRLIDLGRRPVNARSHGPRRSLPDKPDDPLTLLVKQDLDPLSIEELQARIAILKAEIARVEAQLAPGAIARAAG